MINSGALKFQFILKQFSSAQRYLSQKKGTRYECVHTDWGDVSEGAKDAYLNISIRIRLFFNLAT